MTEKEFVDIAMPIGLTFTIGYMVFIMYKLGKDSKAGRFGMGIIFLALGLGIFGFVLKFVIKLFLQADIDQ